MLERHSMYTLSCRKTTGSSTSLEVLAPQTAASGGISAGRTSVVVERAGSASRKLASTSRVALISLKGAV